jgi:plastocyanin
MGSDMRGFAIPIVGVFVVTIIYAAVTLVNPKLVPFSNHPHEVNAVVPVVTPSTSAAASPTTGAAAATSPAASGGTTLALTAQSIQFDKTKLEANAGTVTIEFDNKDSGIPHNVHVYKGSDATGDSVGMTDIATGPTTQTLTIDLAASTYYYQCDVHPTTMNGTLTVN